MSKYMLRHDEANCIGCLACEVHCKTNKDLGPGPAPCKIVAVGPLEVNGQPRVRFVFALTLSRIALRLLSRTHRRPASNR